MDLLRHNLGARVMMGTQPVIQTCGRYYLDR